jgi:hypothetical protein
LLLNKLGVGSTGERNGLCRCSSRCTVANGLAGPRVELWCDQVEVVLAVYREIVLPGQVLPQEPVGVLARATLPRALRIAEVDLEVGCEAKLLVGGHLCTSLPAPRYNCAELDEWLMGRRGVGCK